MRKISYLSPSSISLFYQDVKQFYMNYLCEEKPPKPLQTKPMAAGSAFDAYAKSFLHEKLFGKGYDPRFDLVSLFESQVEEQNRDWAWPNGKYLFEVYTRSGALADLMLELSGSINKPKFELEVKGVVEGYKEGVTRDVKGVILLGKPDVLWTNKSSCRVVLDFKVNGFCGNYNFSPMQGYLRIRGLTGRDEGSHKKCIPMNHNGMMINIAEYFEYLDTNWAAQLSIYNWLAGGEVGEDFICAIDQIAANGKIRLPYPTVDRQGNTIRIDVPEIRVAEHRLRVSSDFQYKVLAKAQEVWEIIHSDHIFRDMPKQQSQEMCQFLDQAVKGIREDANEMDLWLLESARK